MTPGNAGMEKLSSWRLAFMHNGGNKLHHNLRFLLSLICLFCAAEQDVHLPREGVRVAGRLQLKAALSVPQRNAHDQHSAAWWQHQQLACTVYPSMIIRRAKASCLARVLATLVIGRLLVRISVSPRLHNDVWAGYWTPNCSWWAAGTFCKAFCF